MSTLTESIVSAREIPASRSAFASTDLPNLDFMRAVAVLLVLFGHLTYFLGLMNWGPVRLILAGIMGVQIFFVHTCLVLMLSLERQWKNQSAAELFGSFMVRRVFRIYPLSIFVICLVVAFRLPMAELHSGQFVAMPLHPGLVVSNLLLVQSSRYSILGPTWSLPYEMAMYLFLPWLFLLLYPNKSCWKLLAGWLLSVFAGLTFLAYGGGKYNNFLLYVACFLPGVIAYQLQRTPRRQLPAFVWPGVVVGVVLLFLWNQNLVANTWITGWIACLALGISAPFFAQITAPWLTEPSRLIAKYSYGIYLTHFFCIWLMFDVLHYVLPRAARLALFVVLVVLLSVGFYHFLEEPLIQLGKRVAKRFEKRRETCSTSLAGA
jgi:peptidoglycan/LPS O-acetylase OafA/YrhL